MRNLEKLRKRLERHADGYCLSAHQDFELVFAEVDRLQEELDRAWRAALEAGNQNTALQGIIRRHAAAIVDETAKEVQGE